MTQPGSECPDGIQGGWLSRSEIELESAQRGLTAFLAQAVEPEAGAGAGAEQLQPQEASSRHRRFSTQADTGGRIPCSCCQDRTEHQTPAFNERKLSLSVVF